MLFSRGYDIILTIFPAFCPAKEIPNMEKSQAIMSKITIIGAGSVGATIANDMVTMGIATEIVLIDVKKE